MFYSQPFFDLPLSTVPFPFPPYPLPFPPYPFPSFPILLFPIFLSRVGQQPSGDGRFWLRANKPVYKVSVFEDEHGGNTLNLKLSSRARIFIDIQLGHAVTAI